VLFLLTEGIRAVDEALHIEYLLTSNKVIDGILEGSSVRILYPPTEGHRRWGYRRRETSTKVLQGKLVRGCYYIRVLMTETLTGCSPSMPTPAQQAGSVHFQCRAGTCLDRDCSPMTAGWVPPPDLPGRHSGACRLTHTVRLPWVLHLCHCLGAAPPIEKTPAWTLGLGREP
jgi:hypothetical protein